MTDNKIIKDFGKGIKQLGVETVEKLVEETGKILDPTITAQELLGDIKPMSDEEMARKRAEDEKKKQDEINKLKQGEKGRNVEDEIKQISKQKEKEEEEREKYFEQLKEQKEKEKEQQEAEYNGLMMESANPSKQKKNRGSAFANKKKKSQPDQSQMSQTSEFKGKIN